MSFSSVLPESQILQLPHMHPSHSRYQWLAKSSWGIALLCHSPAHKHFNVSSLPIKPSPFSTWPSKLPPQGSTFMYISIDLFTICSHYCVLLSLLSLKQFLLQKYPLAPNPHLRISFQGQAQILMNLSPILTLLLTVLIAPP